MARHLQLAGTVVVLLCALMDAEAARGGSSIHAEWDTDSSTDRLGIHRLNVHVDGFDISPGVMHQLLLHQLRCFSSSREAVAELITMVICAVSERHAAILRVMLVLEGGLVQTKDLASLWESLASHASGQVWWKRGARGLGGGEVGRWEGSAGVPLGLSQSRPSGGASSTDWGVGIILETLFPVIWGSFVFQSDRLNSCRHI